MFHFPGCPPMRLWIHLMVTGHYPGRVPPFGYSWINAYLQLPRTFRSLSRPSSAISAMASTLRSYSLDLRRKLSQPSDSRPSGLRFARSSQIVCQFYMRCTPKTIEMQHMLSICSWYSCAVFKVRRAFARTHLLPPFLPRRIGFNSLPSALDGLRIWV